MENDNNVKNLIVDNATEIVEGCSNKLIELASAMADAAIELYEKLMESPFKIIIATSSIGSKFYYMIRDVSLTSSGFSDGIRREQEDRSKQYNLAISASITINVPTVSVFLRDITKVREYPQLLEFSSSPLKKLANRSSRDDSDPYIVLNSMDKSVATQITRKFFAETVIEEVEFMYFNDLDSLLLFLNTTDK